MRPLGMVFVMFVRLLFVLCLLFGEDEGGVVVEDADGGGVIFGVWVKFGGLA